MIIMRSEVVFHSHQKKELNHQRFPDCLNHAVKRVSTVALCYFLRGQCVQRRQPINGDSLFLAGMDDLFVFKLDTSIVKFPSSRAPAATGSVKSGAIK
jgi:hypothetical protein